MDQGTNGRVQYINNELVGSLLYKLHVTPFNNNMKRN